MSLSLYVAAPAPPGGIGAVIGGVSPGWGPFAALGAQAVTIIDVTMAVVLAACFVLAIIGASKQRVGGAGRNSMQAEEGKGLVISAIAGAFLVASLGTIFTIVYGLGI